MIIAVNTKCPPGEFFDGIEDFVLSCITRLANHHPQHHFIIITNTKFEQKIISSKNITSVVAGPLSNSPLLWQIWHQYKLPAVLKKYKADVFISANGMLSFRSKIPQTLLLPSLAFIQHPKLFGKKYLRLYTALTPNFLAKANAVLVFSTPVKDYIIDHFSVNKQKINIISNFAGAVFYPFNAYQQEKVKEKYTAGKAYFLFPGHLSESSNLLNLLKAFSFFKKRQKTNMLLVIAQTAITNDTAFDNAFKTYKFRNEVIRITDTAPEVIAQLTAAAYALVYPVLADYLCSPLFQAMQCGTPVICSNGDSAAAYCGNAALYVNPGDINDIAEKMMLLFKDENKCKELGHAGKINAVHFTIDHSARQLWQSLSGTIK